MKRPFTMIAGLTAALLMALPALAGHDDNPSPRVASYTYDIGELNVSGVEGTVRIKALPNGKAQIKVTATGLAPNLPHAQHLHGTTDGTPTQCPLPSADVDGNGLITVAEGGPFYGGILASLTTTGDTGTASALAVDRYPVTDEAGNLDYVRTFDVPAEVFASLGNVQYVVHGIDLDGSGSYDGPARSSIAPNVPLEVTIPAGCGGILN